MISKLPSDEIVVDSVSVVVGRNCIVFGIPTPEGILTVPCTRVKPAGVVLALRMGLGNSVNAKPAPRTTTATSSTTMASLYLLWL